MSNVVNFQKQERHVWVCHCGCTTFELLSDGSAVCAHCEREATGAGDGWLDMEETRKSPQEPEKTFRSVKGNGSEEFRKRRITQLAADEDVCLVVIANRDGFVSAWRDGESTDERQEWFARRLEDARKLIGGK